MTTIEPITGRYVHVEVEEIVYRTYFEESGTGVPLICLHTAGADSRQYRHLLSDHDIARRHRIIAFDMPWHGRSLPPDGWWQEEYRLTRNFYVKFIAAFCRALGVTGGILMGCSMGGYVVLDVAHELPGMFSALIGVQTRDYAPHWTYLVDASVHPEVNFHSFMPIIGAVAAPVAPEVHRREVEWVYASNGPGVMRGDFSYAAEDHDARPFLHQLDAESVRIFVIGGDWDPSCLPEHTDELARLLPGLRVTRIPDAGHFPPAENPSSFKAALLPILDEIAASHPPS